MGHVLLIANAPNVLTPPITILGAEIIQKSTKNGSKVSIFTMTIATVRRAPNTLMAYLIYSDPAHEYHVDGMRVPSVTEILRAAGLATDYSAIDPAVLERARQRGEAVHAIVERISGGEEPDPFLPADVRGYQDAYLQFVRDTGWRVNEWEIKLHHPELLYAGRADAVGMLRGLRTLLDWKSSATIDHVPTAPQVAAYALAWEAVRPDGQVIAQIGAVHLRKDGLYSLHLYDRDEATRIFRYALEIYRYRRKHKK